MCASCGITELMAGDVVYRRLRAHFASNPRVHLMNMADVECHRFTGRVLQRAVPAGSCCMLSSIVSMLTRSLVSIVSSGLACNTDVFVDSVTIKLVDRTWCPAFGILTKNNAFLTEYSRGKLV